MTNERAIELLNRISDSQFDGIHGDERREALSMAVRALEQNLVQESGGLVKDLVKDCISRKMAIDAFEPEHDTDWYTPQIIEVLEALPPVQPTQTNAQPTQFNACDCISRQAAIDAAKELCLHYTPTKSVKHPHIDFVVEELERLPSAQPQWIPCSERLPEHPENDDYYLVTIQCEHYDGWDDYVTGFAEWTKHGWDELSCYIGQIKVIAWMPLPKPYGGESE